jgi:hypothetical protein
MINGNEDPDGCTCPPHVACMKSLKEPHSLMLPHQQVGRSVPAAFADCDG